MRGRRRRCLRLLGGVGCGSDGVVGVEMLNMQALAFEDLAYTGGSSTYEMHA